MLTQAVESYLALRRAVGFALKSSGFQLKRFAAFSEARKQRYISTAIGFAARSTAGDHHPIRSLSAQRRSTPRGSTGGLWCREAIPLNPLHSDRRTDPTTHRSCLPVGT